MKTTNGRILSNIRISVSSKLSAFFLNIVHCFVYLFYWPAAMSLFLIEFCSCVQIKSNLIGHALYVRQSVQSILKFAFELTTYNKPFNYFSVGCTILAYP